MPNEHWSVTETRETTQWNKSFKEHWTFKHSDEGITYKLRVVGPNGEVCRREMSRSDAPRDIRAEFEDKFRDAAQNA